MEKILSLAEPTLAGEAFGWDPSKVTTGSNTKRPWVCRFGHVWVATVANRMKGTGCPYCTGRRVLAGFNDLATVNPNLATQAYNWDPTTVTAGCDQKMEWICDEGHIWEAKVVSRNRGSGCPFCAGLRTLAGYNDIATTHPELAKEACDFDPTTLTAGSNKVVRWKCKNDHIWEAMVNNRSHGTGCPDCRRFGLSDDVNGIEAA